MELLTEIGDLNKDNSYTIYCNFERNVPVPDVYRSVCSDRPNDYDLCLYR